MQSQYLTNSPWGYTGESHDIEGGLVYLRARYYEPNTGRFIQQDSYPYFGDTKNPLTRNLYIYGNGNPVMYTDPSGHFGITAIITYLLKNAAETVPDVLLDYIIEGSSFKWWKSALSNYGYNLIPIIGETKTAKQVAKVARKYGDNVVKYLTKHGDDLFKHRDELLAATKKGKNAVLEFIKKRYDEISKGGRKIATGSSEVKILLDKLSELSGTNREKLLFVVKNNKLRSVINELYRVGAKVGDGGTADIIKQEFMNGTSDHLQKGKDRLTQLRSIIRNEKLNLSELDIVEALITDLENAIRLYK